MKHIKTFESFLNEAKKSSVKPNVKLKNDTGFPYAMFYFLNQNIDPILIDFENPDHISVIELLADQEKEFEKNGELDYSSIQKGREIFKKNLGVNNIPYGKLDGAQCSFKLSSTPDVDLNTGKKEWFAGEGIEMKKFILK